MCSSFSKVPPKLSLPLFLVQIHVWSFNTFSWYTPFTNLYLLPCTSHMTFSSYLFYAGTETNWCKAAELPHLARIHNVQPVEGRSKWDRISTTSFYFHNQLSHWGSIKQTLETKFFLLSTHKCITTMSIQFNGVWATWAEFYWFLRR